MYLTNAWNRQRCIHHHRISRRLLMDKGLPYGPPVTYPYWKQCVQRWPALTRSSFHLVGGSFQPQRPSSPCCMVRLLPLQLVPKRQDRTTTRSRWQERDGFGWRKTGLANLGKALSSSRCLLI